VERRERSGEPESARCEDQVLRGRVHRRPHQADVRVAGG
jgi:hypothetical protein